MACLCTFDLRGPGQTVLLGQIFMRLKVILSLLALILLLPLPAVFGQDASLVVTNTDGLTTLMAKVRVDLNAGKHTEAELADDLRQFDNLLAAENGKRTEMAANIILAKGMLYSEVFDDPEQAKTYILDVQRNYSNTMIAKKLEPLLMMMDQQAETKRDEAGPINLPFADFSVTNLDGKPMSVSQYKGKLVFVDFWATWCPLCVAEMPNVIATYGKYHDQGFEIVGVSLDEDKGKLQNFIKDNGMPWPQYFDGQRWQNLLALKYGIEELPANLLIDTNGNIIGKNLIGVQLPVAVAKALAKNLAK